MYFNREDIARNVDAGTFARGEKLAAAGCVLRVINGSDTIEGEVMGSAGAAYTQRIRVTEGRGGVTWSGRCSCPVSANCKHVVAVLLTDLERASRITTIVDADAEDWLEHLATVRDEAETNAAVPPRPHHQYDCVLIPSYRSGRLCLHLAKVKLHDDGRRGAATVLRDTFTVLAGYLEPEDEALVRAVAGLRAGAMYGDEEIEPAGRAGARLLVDACAAGRLYLAGSINEVKRGDMLAIGRGEARAAALQWRELPAQQQPKRAGGLTLGWSLEDGAPLQHALLTDPPLYVHEGSLGQLTLPAGLAALRPDALHRLLDGAPALGIHQRAAVATAMAERGLDRLLPLPSVIETRTVSGVAPVPHLLLDARWERRRYREQTHDFALITFDYDGLSTEGCADPVLRRARAGVVELIERDEEAERAALGFLIGLGFSFAPASLALSEVAHEALQLATPDDWLNFVRQGVPHLRRIGWEIEFGDNFRYQVFEPQDWYADLNEGGEGVSAWFELELGIIVNGRREPLLPLLIDMIRAAPEDFDPASLAARDDSSEVLVSLPDDTLVALPWPRVRPILDTLGELYFTDRFGKAIRLPVIDAARLAELEAAARMRWLGGERLRELGRKLSEFDGIRLLDPPAGLRAELRPYQRTGLAWLQFLREYGFGGILADDMGLGKTVQTLAHILAEKEAGRLDRPALVVAPTSLMGNWQDEAARFAPGLRVLLLHGKERKEQFARIPEADLVLTTYPLLGRDEPALREHRYHLLILDEAQYIKNSRAKATQTVRLLDARHRLCLTGTPVQNHLGELWSQFHFLMPGLLGEEKTFNAQVRKPIEIGGDTQRQAWLARRLRPFMLRRTKDKVATELPPKTEIVFPVELGGAQRDLYETVRVAMDRKVREAIDTRGLARSQIILLDALLKLRQVCCDPRLMKHEGGSAKLEALLELLETLLSEGRKVLVFSQFTSMLALIEAELQARAISYVLLTGDTQDRATPVRRFQAGEVGVFLISLKAGGVGLNLTAADTVIHYDPWWNPASENQATDRAWRIGQEQPVFVYKLIARGTLEEKIQDMQRRKGELAAGVLSNEATAELTIGADDMRALFAPPPSSA